MRVQTFSFRLAILALVLFTTGATGSDGPVASPEKDWPQWRGPRRDGVSTETALLKCWPTEGPPLLWKIDGIGQGWSSPIVVGESIYITGDKDGEVHIHCLDLQGKTKWTAKNGGAWMQNYPGSRACCAFSEGFLYHLNAYGRLAAFEADSGKEVWNVPNILQEFESKNITWGLSECPLVDGPNLIISPSGPKAMLVALDKKTGKLRWCSESLPGDRASYASPIMAQIANRRVIIGLTSHHGYGVDADTGTLLWSVAVRNNWGATSCSPVYHDGAVFYAAPDGAPGTLYRVNPISPQGAPEPLWRSHVEPLNGGALYKDGILYTNGCKKTRALHAIDWKTGESRYELELSSPTNNHATGALLWADQQLYALFENGILALLRPTADHFEINGHVKLFDASKSDAWAHPVLLNGRLYLRYHDSLWCFDVKQP